MHHGNRRSLTSSALAAAFLLHFFFLPTIGEAGQHWFSGPINRHPTLFTLAVSRAPVAQAAGSPQLFDVVVSLHNNPTGDDNGNTQGVDPSSAAQDKIERILQHFADGVYESTEGAHKIRKIRVFRNQQQEGKADVVWTDAGHPHATVNGIARSGLHIYTYDTFVGGEGPGHDHDMLADEIGAGYTLAHEWAHYAYGVLDEYAIETGDVAVVPSIMNSQWNARAGDNRWLNFSIAFQSDPPGDFQNTRKTNQHRRYGASCWEVLGRSPSFFDRLRALFGAEPLRVFYPTLQAVAPTGTGMPHVPDLPGSARSDLDIIWMKNALTYEIVIDRSGSMAGTKIDNAKTAAKLLIDLATVGSTKIGIIAFDSTPITIAPITTITNDAAKAPLRSAIDGITADDGTSIGAGAQAALNALLALGTTDDTKVVFLLTDGVSGDNALAPIPAYVANQIPILAFSYGSDADTATLGQMATATKGKLFISPVALADVSQAFQTASSFASGQTNIASGTGTASANLPSMPTITVDATVTRLTVSITHHGSPSVASFQIDDPSASHHLPTRVSQSGGDTLSFFDIQAPAAGLWRVSVVTGAGTPFQYQASAEAASGTYSLDAESALGDTLQYPQPLVITASLGKELPIAGASVTATITSPTGVVRTIALADDGVTPDEHANDGRYAAIVTTDQSGVYDVLIRAKASAGSSRLTPNGLELSTGVNGTLVPPMPDQPIQESYERFEHLQVTVTGAIADDHGNTPATATTIAGTNAEPRAGRIERGGDVDVFVFTVPPTATTMAMRVTDLALGMSPGLRVLAADGTTVLGNGTFATNRTAGGYLAVTVPSTPGTLMYAEVRHTDSIAGTGLYAVSAGTPLAADVLGTAIALPNIAGTLSVTGQFTPNGVVSYRVTLSNTGNVAQEDRPGHELTDVLPADLVLATATATAGSPVADVGANTVTWDGSIPAHGSVTITINATVAPSALGKTISNQGTINYDGDGLGTNWSIRRTDDPATVAADDPTSFVASAVVGNVPAITFPGLLLLTLMLGLSGVLATRH